MRKSLSQLTLITLLALFLSGCAMRGVNRVKDLTFEKNHRLQLDVYAGDKVTSPKKVLVFIHGGRWKSGRKDHYKFLGRRFARKDVIMVVASYRLSPKADYRGMAMDVASAVKWTHENIASYGGDKEQIYLAGHSAGGHLAALVANDKRYFDSLNIDDPLKGVVLIDAFGLQMDKFMSNPSNTMNPVYFKVFSNDSSGWKKGSPDTYIRKGIPPSVIFIGGKTFPVIQQDGKEYAERIRPFDKNVQVITCPKKSHIPMIFQFYNPDNKIYSDILSFMGR